jgi:hypothetical protein
MVVADEAVDVFKHQKMLLSQYIKWHHVYVKLMISNRCWSGLVSPAIGEEEHEGVV